MKQMKKTQLEGLISGLSSVLPMCTLLFCIVLSTFLGTHLTGQIPQTRTFAAASGGITYIKFGSTYSKDTYTDKVGYQLVSANRTYRMGLQYNVGIIPTNATITSCQLEFWSGVNCTDCEDGTIIFTKLRWDFPNLSNSETVFDLIRSGTAINGIQIWPSQTYYVTLASFVQDIQNAIQSSNPYVGIGAYYN